LSPMNTCGDHGQVYPLPTRIVLCYLTDLARRAGAGLRIRFPGCGGHGAGTSTAAVVTRSAPSPSGGSLTARIRFT
jgi:hypothetical protein